LGIDEKKPLNPLTFKLSILRRLEFTFKINESFFVNQVPFKIFPQVEYWKEESFFKIISEPI